MRTVLAASVVSLLASCGAAKSPMRLASPEMTAGAVAPGYPEEPSAANTEDYTDYGKNPWVDRRRRIGSRRSPPTSTPRRTRSRAASSCKRTRCRRRRRCASRSGSTTSTTASRRRTPGTPFSTVMEAAPHPFARRPLRPARRRRDESEDGRRAQAERARVPRRRLGLDGQPTTSSALAKQGAAHPHRQPDREGRGLDRHLRRRQPRRAADDEHRSQGSHPQSDRLAARRAARPRWPRASTSPTSRRRSGSAPARSRASSCCSDGDANVGAHSHDEMLKIIEDRAKAGRHAVDDRLRHGQLQGHD